MSKQKPPTHLGRAGRGLWRAVVAARDLEPHKLRLLALACEALDRGEAARLALAEHGATYTDRFGQPRSRPEVAIERDARIGFARLMRELDSTPKKPAVASELMEPLDW